MRKNSLAAVAAVALGLGLAACGGNASPSETDTENGAGTDNEAATDNGACAEMYDVGYHAFAGSLNNTVAVVAEAQGFFADHCINAERVNIDSAPAAFQLAVTGAVDFVNTAPDNVIISRGAGLDVKLVANQFSNLYYSLVVSEHHSELKGKSFEEVMEALQGKKIGVTVLGGNNEFIARANFTGAGLDPDSATYVALGASSSSIAALTNGTVDAAELYGNAQDIAVALGEGFIVNDTRVNKSDSNPVPQEIADLDSTLTWGALTSFMDENPEATRGFVAANDEAVAWIDDPANREELYEILADEAPIPDDVPNSDEVFRSVVDIYADQISSELTESNIEAWVTFVESFADLENPVSAADVIYTLPNE